MPVPVIRDREEVTGTFADVTVYDATPLSSRKEAHNLAQRLAYLRTSPIERTDVHFSKYWTTLLSLPFPEMCCDRGVESKFNLKCLTVDDRPAIRSIKLTRPLYERLPSNRSTRKFERWIVKHVRSPDVLWIACSDWSSPITATASGSLRGWWDLGREAVLQSVIYAALTYQVTGAVLGLCAFRASFGRVFALSGRILTMDDIRTPAEREAEGMAEVLDAEAFIDFVTGMGRDSAEGRLPFTFTSKEEGTNDTQLEVLSDWTHAAHRLILDQPRNGKFTRLPPVMSEFVTGLLARAETETAKPPPLSHSSTMKRRTPPSPADDAPSKCRRLNSPNPVGDLEAEEDPVERPEPGYDADDERVEGDGENEADASDTESEWSQSEDLPSEIDDGPVEMPQAIIDLKSSAALGARYLLTPKGRGPTLYVYAKIVRALDVKVMFLPPADMDRLAEDVEAQSTGGRGPAPSCREDNK